MQRRSVLLLIISAFQLFSLSAFVFAQPQQSESFRITKSVLDAGGGTSTSANFRLTSAFGQPTPVGAATSANFSLYAGFLTPTFSVSPLSPIQDLVIQRVGGTSEVKLDWGVIPSASSYTVYRSTDPGFAPSPGNQVGTSATNSFTDPGAVNLPAVRHYYIVIAGTGANPAAVMPNEQGKRTTTAPANKQ